MDRSKLVNIALFLERVADNGLLKGKTEVVAWAETFQEVVAQINALDKQQGEPK